MTHSISFKSKDTEKPKENSKNIVKKLANSIPKTIKHFFPRFTKELEKIADHRKKTDYDISELLLGAISLFLFKQGSRNSFNNDRKDDDFIANYKKLFGMRLPHQDTINDLFRVLNPLALEKFKTSMIRELIEKKVLHQWRLLGKYFRVAIDGTGINSYTQKALRKMLNKNFEEWKEDIFS